MQKIIILFLSFFKIGAFSFGGGYAMLPFIQQEFINKNNYVTNKEFLDLLALSQSTPGPIAINSATFVGYKVSGIIGSLVASFSVVIFSLVGLTIISHYFNKFKDNKLIDKILITIRPITVGFILAATISSSKDISWGFYSIFAFVSSFYLLYTQKVGSIAIIFIYGAIGVIISFF